MAKLQIAVAGAGAIGRVHMAVLASHDTCALSAVVDPTDSAQILAKRYGVPWYATLDELLNQSHPDGVILAVPNVLHVPMALRCIEDGIPVLVEKPIAHTVTDAMRLVEAARIQNAKVLVGHHRAHSAIMAVAQAAIREGRLGQLVSVMGSAIFYKPSSYFTDAPWRSQVGGGPILINLIHDIHNLRMLCGDVVQVQAMASNVVRGLPVEDTAAINLRFANGVLGTFLVSDTSASPRSWEQTSQENSAYASSVDDDCYFIAGTKGSLSVPTMRLKVYTGEASWFTAFDCTQLKFDRHDPLVLQISHFADVIQGAAVPLVSAVDGLQNLYILEAINKAIQSGQMVSVMSI
jgi:predicted dehydrogenase